MKKKIKFMCTAFRDGLQSVYGARVFSKDYFPAIEAAKAAGINYFEAGGGALFQSPYFYCNEDSFKIMAKFRNIVGPSANLQTLARGVNVVGLESQSSDIIQLHAKLFKKYGITTIRNFDALNDVNNLIFSGQAIHDAGLKHQICVTMMELPPNCPDKGTHTAEYYTRVVQEIIKSKVPFDSICFKDASGTSVPRKVYETIKNVKKIIPGNCELQFHTHETAGCAITAYMSALEAGADVIDLSLAPCSGGTGQPDVIVMWHALRGTNYDLDIDIDKVRTAEEVFKDSMKEYFLPPEALAVEPLIPWSPMPGGALTANTQMLRDYNIMDKYPTVIKAMREVVEAGGFGTSVTPVSQFYFQQAFNNVMFGEWKKIVDGYGKMVLGYYGKTPVEPNSEVVRLASEQLKLPPTKMTALEMNDKNPEKSIVEIKKILEKENLATTEENIFIVATCKDKGIKFLKGVGEIGVRKNTPASSTACGATNSATSNSASTAINNKKNVLIVNGEKFEVEVKENGQVMVNGNLYNVQVGQQVQQAQVQQAQVLPSTQKQTANQVQTISSSENGEQVVRAQMPGKVFKLVVNPGAMVKLNQPIVILEAMKMEIPVISPRDGIVKMIAVKEGQQVSTGDIVVYLA